MGVASGTGCSFRNMGGNRERRERDSLRSMGMETEIGVAPGTGEATGSGKDVESVTVNGSLRTGVASGQGWPQ